MESKNFQMVDKTNLPNSSLIWKLLALDFLALVILFGLVFVAAPSAFNPDSNLFGIILESSALVYLVVMIINVVVSIKNIYKYGKQTQIGFPILLGISLLISTILIYPFILIPENKFFSKLFLKYFSL